MCHRVIASGCTPHRSPWLWTNAPLGRHAPPLDRTGSQRDPGSMRAILCVILLVPACGGDDGPPDPINEEPPALVGITDAHNQVRATVGVPPLVWGGQL